MVSVERSTPLRQRTFIATVGTPSLFLALPNGSTPHCLQKRCWMTLSEQQVRDFCRSQLAAYKIPKRVRFVNLADIPVNDSGKIVKARLRALGLFEVQP